MAADPTCALCAHPLHDNAYVCQRCGDVLGQALATAADLAQHADETAAGQRSTGPAVRGSSGVPSLPFSWPASDAAWTAANTITTWARHVAEHRGLPAPRPVGRAIGPLCRAGLGCKHPSCHAIRPGRPQHPVAAAALWLVDQLDWIRHRPEAGEAFDELTYACRLVRWTADATAPERVIVGACECGQHLYASRKAATVTCRTCDASYDVVRSREILLKRLDDMLMTAAEIATMALWLDPDRNRQRVRNLINAWASRHQIIAHSDLAGDPLYVFGEVRRRLTESPSKEKAA